MTLLTSTRRWSPITWTNSIGVPRDWTVPITMVPIAPEAQWALQSERGLTYSAEPPDNARIVAGEWWPSDYSGAPLISFSADLARGFGIGIGDTLTVNVLGREMTGTVANLRDIEWGTLQLNFTNEGGVGRTYRLLKNIMGLWILEECRRTWLKAGQSLSYAEMIAQAGQAEPFRSLIDPDDDLFLNPLDMPAAIREFCQRTGQPLPDSVGAYVRCILESLALKYRYVLEMTERLSGKSFAGLHMVGGGIKNAMLCQFTSNALGKPVWAGPTEGSGIGNILVQYMTLGDISDIWEARKIVRDSFPIETYEPQQSAEWQEAYARFQGLLSAAQ